MEKPITVIGFLGSTLDAGKFGPTRWSKWRPSVALAMHDTLPIDRFILLYGSKHQKLADQVSRDITTASPQTRVEPHLLDLTDPWDFEEVYGKLLDFALSYPLNPDAEDYLIHITTGTHVVQICLFLLTEARFLPGKLLQSHMAPAGSEASAAGRWSSIDLDLSRYDSLATRFAKTARQNASVLKSGIETRNHAFNLLIDEIEQVSSRSSAPILLLGATGVGKSQLARRIYDLKRSLRQISGPLVEVNCATLRGDSAMSTLFGHRRGAFTGAVADRSGLMLAANGGLLFLDEIGELGLDEQAMILRALEDKRFLPVGSDREVTSDFQLIAGTNRDLGQAITAGTFRADLYARLTLWSFTLPSLADRREDLEPNLSYELAKYTEDNGLRVTFNSEARQRYLAFALSKQACWSGNFRDLTASVTRMATFSKNGRITLDCVEREISRLLGLWGRGPKPTAQNREPDTTLLSRFFNEGQLDQIDHFDRVQLAEVIRICQSSSTLSEAGRHLFAASQARKASGNDADRLRKYLARFSLDWHSLRPP